MVTTTWAPPGLGQFVDWNTPADWSPNSVPNSSTADVIIPVITQAGGSVYDSYITIGAHESFVVNSLTLDQVLLVDGTLAIAGTLAIGGGGEVDLSGTLTLGALVNAGIDIQGSGLIGSMGSIDNQGEIVGASLTINAATLQNDGLLVSDGADFTVGVAPGGTFANLSGGVLTGGTYEVLAGDTLNLTGAGAIVVDAADIILGTYGTAVATVNSDAGMNGALTPLTQTLQTIAAAGSLTVQRTSFDATGALLDQGALTLTDGTLTTAGLTIAAGGAIGGTGVIAGPVTDDGTLNVGTYDGDAAGLMLAGAVDGSGTITIDPVANEAFSTNSITPDTLELAGPASAAVAFNGFNSVLALDNPSTFSGAIAGFSAGIDIHTFEGGNPPSDTPASDEIILKGLNVDAVSNVAYSGSDTAGTLTVTTTTGTIALDFVGDYTASDFVLSAGPQVLSSSPPSIEITEAQPCFASGTRLMTDRGPVAVENLVVGDLVRTARGGGFSPIRWIGHRRVECARHPRPWDLWPVRIAVNAFAPGRPERPLWLSPDHAVLSNGVLIPIRFLINGATVVQQPRDAVTYWHVELPRHDIVLAEGLPAESFLDTGNRGAFSNGGVPLHLHPDFALRVWEAEGCAPLVREGPALVAAKRRLLAGAKALGHRQTRDAALRLVIDGEATRASVAGRTYRFWVRRGARDVRLVSRSAVPADTHADSLDHRRLGVAIARIEFAGETLALDDPRLLGGWHTAERSATGATWRWTDGDAALSLAAGGMLSIEVRMTEIYWLDEAASDGAQKFA